MKEIKIATRKSILALWQSEHIKARIEAQHNGMNVVLEGMKTRGDVILDTPLAKIGGKGRAEEEAERLKTRHGVDATRVASADQLNQFLECRAIRKQLSDIAEQDAGFRKIRDLQHVAAHQSGDPIAKLTDHR